MFKDKQITVKVGEPINKNVKMDNFVLIGIDDKHKSDISWAYMVCEGEKGIVTMIKVMAYMAVIGQNIGNAILASHDGMTKENLHNYVEMAMDIVKKKQSKHGIE